jgi:hypothetical protein
MGEVDERTESDGKGLFIIATVRRSPSTRLGSGCRYFRESSSASHLMALRLKCRTRPPHRQVRAIKGVAENQKSECTGGNTQNRGNGLIQQ